MEWQGGRSRLWRADVLVLLLVMAVGLATVPACLFEARDAARRATCINRMKMLGIAMHSFHDKFNMLPPSCHVQKDGDTGKILALDGWSWQVDLLPYMEQMALYDTLDVRQGKPLEERSGVPAGSKPHAAARATVIQDLLCPSYSGSPFADSSTKADALTNYKLMGATHIESLGVASPQPTKPKYGEPPQHPDGAGFPGSRLSFRDFQDGTAHTILAVETIEPRFARWTVGADAAVVGLPRIVEFTEVLEYYAPKGYSPGKIGAESTVDASYRTYLAWDYAKNSYDGADGSKAGKYGPSSNHWGVVNHLFADASVNSITTKDMDPALYMFLITRNGADPASAFEP